MGKRKWGFLIATTGVAMFCCGLSHAQTVVVPNANTTLEGSNGLSTPIRSAARTIQMIISASELASVPIGDQFTGISFRLDNTQLVSRPDFAITFANYDLYMGQAAVTPATANNTLALNYSPGSKTQVRGGALNLAAGAFSNGGSGATPNAFAATIAFNLNGGGYTYKGGDIVLELTHSGNLNTDFALDAAVNSTTATALGDTGYNATTNTNITSGLMPVVRFSYAPVVLSAPEPGTLALLGVGAIGLLIRRRRA